MKKNQLITVLMLLFATGVFAQRNFFQSVSGGQLPQAREITKTITKKGIYKIDEAGMRAYLLGAPMEFKGGTPVPLIVALPDGTTETFNIVESPVLSAKQAAAHPEIKTYTGNGTKDKKSVIRLSLTSSGFNAIILNVNGDAVNFEPYSKTQSGIYINYFSKDAVRAAGGLAPPGGSGGHDFKLPPNGPIKVPSINNGNKNSRANTSPTGSTLTIFRLAVAADGEFTAAHTDTTGAYNFIVEYVNKANAFYRNELSVGFVLVSGKELIYPNSNTDPYTNDDQEQMLSANQTTLDAITGSANYDIGHVMGYFPGTSGGGLAQVGCVCNNQTKAQGVSSDGDLNFYAQSFYDKLFFHEMGHQFGMTHSYNSSIQVCTSREPSTSVEPGAGATVMSYSMICGGSDGLGDNYMPLTTDGTPNTGNLLQFHTVSYQQAVTYLASVQPYPAGVVVTTTSNTPPVVTMPSAFTIPKLTPFTLTGTATDANSDVLSYAWEGTNTGGDINHPPDANTLTDPAQAPFSRTYAPASTGSRTFPVLDSILSGANTARADKLSSVSTGMNYNLTVRDNHAGSGGVAYGSVTVTVDGTTGPFVITGDPSGDLAGNSSQTITWSVNGTATANPTVKISISTDGGHTFTVLIPSTANDGSEVITLPNVATSTARIKVEANNNIFFDISNVNFTIHTVAATFNIVASTGANGTVTPAGTTSVTSGGSQVYTITPAACYKVANVLVDNVSAGAVTTYTFSNVTSAHSISATFALITDTIRASSGTNGTVTPTGATIVNCGSNQVYTITPATGFSTQSILVDGASVAIAPTYTFSNITANHTISATFAATARTIMASAGANGSISPSGQVNVTNGGSQTFTITPVACFKVADVLVDGTSVGGVGTYTFTNVTANHTITASFSAITYAITAGTSANGTVTPAGITNVNCGGNQVYTITPAAGFATQTILVDGASVAIAPTYTFSNVTATHTISATFAATAKTITASAGVNGTISPSGSVNVASGGSQTFTITPNSCYQVATLMVDGATVANSGTYTFTNVTTNHTISATFSQLSYNIMASTGTNGTVTPAGITSVVCGGSQVYTITPASGFTTQSITVDGASVAVAPTYTFSNVAATHTISAAFTASVATTSYRINAGGPQVTNSIGVFAADNYYTAASTFTNSTSATIAGTTNGAIYQTERYSTSGVMNYAFPVANGSYKVVLHFAEIYLTGQGQRIFDVSIEGNKVLDNYDILKKVAPNTATTETFTTNVTDGTLNIYFSSLAADGGSNSPKVSAIEVIQTSANLSPAANAGPDQTITLPTSSTTLSGSGTDPDGTIAGYTWMQLSGPNQAVFNSKLIAAPMVSGLAAGSYWFTLAVTDNMGAVSPVDTVLVTVNAAGNTPVYRINAGGPQVTNSIGVFAADAYYTAASTFSNSTSATIAGTTNGAIYQTERYGTSGVMNYAFPVTNAQYTVILHFAEIYLTGQNQRVFDVSIEGNKVLDNYDILKKVAPNTATTETFTTNVTDGTLNIYFSSLAADGGSNSPKVSAIEIIRTSTNLAPTANAGNDTTITLPSSSLILKGSGMDADGTIAGYSWSQVSGPNTATFSSTSVASPTVSGLIAGTYWFSLVVTDNMGAASPADMVNVNVNAAGNTPVYRINAGGPQVTNSIGTFAADAYYTASSTFSNSTSAAIAGTTDDAIYQTERYSTSGLLNYAFPVTNGSYKVILHFAEIYLTGMGQRVFNVSIEGTKVLDKYDILKKVAPNTATTETFTTSVTDGTLNILFSTLDAGGSNSPKVSAIEIIKVGTSPTTAIDLPKTSTGLDGSKLSVKLTPNPTTTYVTFHVTSGNSKTLFLRVFGADGKMIESRGNLNANGTIEVGRQYVPGLYYAEVLQGTERVTVKFIKLKN